jgi:pimeloyl-ACP methyl ester carboxylesterase
VGRAKANGIELEYETFGAQDGAPLLLIGGLASQMISWHEDFCAQLAARGFHVIRFDNRDAGLSTRMEEAGTADIAAALGGSPQAKYQLDDMADDAVGLLDHLDIKAAHVVGASMGGFIAQLIALNHPDRVLSLTSIMSGPSWSEGVEPKPEGWAVLIVTPPATREERIELALTGRRALLGSADPFDDALERARASRAIDRAYYPVGVGRQLAAVLAAKPRLERLKNLHVPALVIHGVDDVLVPVENGRLVADALPGARYMEIEGMGHDVPRRVWPQILDAIEEMAREARFAPSQ